MDKSTSSATATITTVSDTNRHLFTKGQSFREIHGFIKKANKACTHNNCWSSKHCIRQSRKHNTVQVVK